MSRLKELNLKRIAFYALGILLCYAGITYMDTWLTKGNQELNDSFNTIDWFCETRIRVLKGNYLLVDTKKERIITKRTVAVCLINNKIYALGEGEYVVYDMETGREKVFIKDNNMHTDVIQPIQHIPEESYKLADKERVLSYSDFTKEEQLGFQIMFMDPHEGRAVYYSPFYWSPYNDGVIDVNNLIEIGFISDWNIKDDVFYAYGRDNFIVITGHGEKIRQYYNEALTLGKRLKTKYCEIDKKKALYGNRYSVLADINEFTPDEIEILHSLWKESFLRRVPEEKEEEEEQEKEMDRVWHKIRTEQ